jgi:hypothetical protein
MEAGCDGVGSGGMRCPRAIALTIIACFGVSISR